MRTCKDAVAHVCWLNNMLLHATEPDYEIRRRGEAMRRRPTGVIVDYFIAIRQGGASAGAAVAATLKELVSSESSAAQKQVFVQEE